MTRLTDLPNDILARIFILLSPYPTLSNASLTHASNAFSLAQCSKQLLQIFRQTILTTIDARQYSNEAVSPHFPGAHVRDPYHLASLVRLAGPYLRHLIIPEYEESEEFSQWPLLKQVCHSPNLHTLGFHDPARPHNCLKRLLARVAILRIVKPSRWCLRHITRFARVLELVNVSASRTRDVLSMVSRCKQLKTLNISLSECHDAGFVPLLVRTLAVLATSVVHVQYECREAPIPVVPQNGQIGSSRRNGVLSSLVIDAGSATGGVVQAFLPLLDEGSYMTTVHSVATVVKYGNMLGITRSVGIVGPVENLEEVVITRVEEALHVLKHSRGLRVMEIGRECNDVEGICGALEGRELEKVIIPGDVVSKKVLGCAKGLGGVGEIVIGELGRDSDIWKLVRSLAGLLRGLRWARWGDGVRVVHVEGCLQVLDGVWQYGRVSGYGALKGLLWEIEGLYDDGGVEFCGLREGIASLVEEGERMMVVDEM